MSRGSLIALTIFAAGGLGAAPMARAQEHDAQFCQMLSAIRGEAPERVGEVVSGTVEGDAPVAFRRRLAANRTYVLLVALSAPATEATVLPATRAGNEAPHREGMRIAHDFTAATGGQVTISFRAPPGTAYHAALYRLPPPTESAIGVRPHVAALRPGGIGAWNSPPEGTARPPDCEPVLPARLGGPHARD